MDKEETGNNNGKWKDYLIVALLILLLLLTGGTAWYAYSAKNQKHGTVTQKEEGRTVVVSDDSTIRELKRQNRELYDSIRKLNDVEYAVKYRYRNVYSTDTVILHDTIVLNGDVKSFSYTGMKGDTFSYSLKIGAEREPYWYDIDFSVSDEFTITNEKVGGVNRTTISSRNGGDIEDPQTYNAKQKRNIFKNIAFGPTVGVGYDPIHNNIGMTIGVSVTYDVFGKLKEK